MTDLVTLSLSIFLFVFYGRLNCKIPVYRHDVQDIVMRSVPLYALCVASGVMSGRQVVELLHRRTRDDGYEKKQRKDKRECVFR